MLFSPDYLTARWTPVPRVVTFHDAMFLRRPQDYNRLWLRVFHWVSLPALRRSAAVIAPSQHAAEETATYAGVSPDRIRVVPQGGPTGGEPMRVAEEAAALVLARYGLRPGEYVLHVGVLERRKNLVTLVRAFDRYRREAAEGNDGTPADWKLVLVGQPGPRPDLDDSQTIRQAIAELGVENDVILTGHVSIAERNALYTRAGAVAVPSLLEGFGIPVLEAFAAGVPVLSARSTSLPEVAGDAALYFDPGSVDELAEAIARIAGDGTLRARLVAAGAERVREFTWARTAAETMAVFEAVAR